MGEYTYVFCDLRTSLPLYEMPLTGVYFTDEQNGLGEFRADFALDRTGYINEHVVSATIPGRCGIIVERDGLPIWDGYITSRWYQSRTKLVSIYAKTIKAYPAEAFIDADFIYTDVEQTQLFLNAWNRLQADPKHNIQVQLPNAIGTGITRSIETYQYEYKTFGSVIDEVANGFNGFDWAVLTSKTNGYYQRRMVLGYPTIGRKADVNTIVFDYPKGSVLNYYETQNQIATHTVGIGAGSGIDMLTSSFVDGAAEAVGLSFDRALSFKEVNDQSALDALTQQAWAQDLPSTWPSVFKIEAKADEDPVFGSYNLGDYLRLAIQDSFHTAYTEKPVRLVRWELYPLDKDNIERVNLTFAGAE